MPRLAPSQPQRAARPPSPPTPPARPQFLGGGNVEDGGVPAAGAADDSNDKKRRGQLRGVVSSLRRPMDLLRGRNKTATGVIIGIALLQVTMELMGRGYEDDFNAFHDHEHWPGMVLMLMRVGMSVGFFVLLRGSLAKQTRPEVSKFLVKLRVVGMTWFLAFPVIVALAPLLFEPYHRHAYITAGSTLTQTVMLLAMMWMTLGNSSYAKVSSLGKMKESMLGALSGISKRRKVCVD